MNCNYCQNRHPPLGVHYNIENVRERFIPTYSHTQIFEPISQNQQVRCTPTFHSTALNVDGYRPPTNQQLKREGLSQKLDQKTTLYRNESRQKRQRDLNSDRNDFYNGSNLWYDPAKKELFASLNGSIEGYSKQRKLADLSSNPVFGGIIMQPYHPSNHAAQIIHAQPDNQITKQEPIAQQIQKNQQIAVVPAQHAVQQVKQKPQETQAVAQQITFGKPQKKSKKDNKTTKVSKVTASTAKPTFTIIRKSRT